MQRSLHYFHKSKSLLCNAVVKVANSLHIFFDSYCNHLKNKRNHLKPQHIHFSAHTIQRHYFDFESTKLYGRVDQTTRFTTENVLKMKAIYKATAM